MIVALKPGVTQESREQLMDWLQNLGLHIHVSEGEYQTILGLVGDTTKVDMDLVASLDIVDSVKRVTEPFKCCNRKFHPEDTVVQVGARNMQNFDLLRELGKLRKPILLKRGLANTLKELLMSAEYIMANGNEQVILCERGIRTFDDYTRNTLDLAAVPMLHELTHLPVIVDPSHATGINRLVAPMAMSATACNADGLIIEVHNDPIHALCDGAQSLRPEQFDVLMGKIREIRKVVTA